MNDLDRALAPYLDEEPLSRAVDLGRIGRYRGFGEVAHALLRMREHGARIEVAGRGHEGHPVLRVEMGPEDAPEAALAISGIHAMEWIGVEVMLSVLEAIAELSVQGRRLIAFPVLNVDGFRRAESHLRARRHLTYVRANARGVDLNRNWPTHWKTTRPVQRLVPLLGGAGSHPGSEPEVRAVLDTIVATKRVADLDRGLSLHSFGRVLLLPWGGRFALPPGYDRLHRHASRVQGALQSRYRIKTPARWIPGLFAHGMELDHLHQEDIDPMLVEISGGGFSLLDPSSWTHPFRWYNPPDPAAHAAELAEPLATFLGYGRAR